MKLSRVRQLGMWNLWEMIMRMMKLSFRLSVRYKWRILITLGNLINVTNAYASNNSLRGNPDMENQHWFNILCGAWSGWQMTSSLKT